MHTVAFINSTPRFPAQPQLEAVGKHKPRVYMNRKEHSYDDLIRITKRPARIYVHGLDRLGDTQKQMRQVILKLTENGVEIYDTWMDVLFQAKAFASVTEAIRKHLREARLPGTTATTRGRKGGNARNGNKPHWQSDPDAKAIWLDPKKTVEQKSDEIGVPVRTLYAFFGKTDASAGRKPKAI